VSYPIFIIGCPRSGTTILGEFFANSKNCDYYNEIDIWNTYKPKNMEISHTMEKIISITRKNATVSMFFKGLRIATRDLCQFLKITRKDFDDKKGQRLDENDVTHKITDVARSFLSGKYLVVKTTPNSLRIPFLRKMFPDAKFIHIVRDGRDVTCSLMNSPSNILWSYIKPPGWKEIKKKYKAIQRCAWQWKTTIDIINSDRSQVPDNDFIEIKYEELIAEPEKIIQQLFGKLGIDFEESHKQLCKKVQNKIKPTELSKFDRATVLDHSSRIERYKQELTEQEIDMIESILGYK
jgi:LPS sulfotransferase NodH